ncbi:MAG TPA: peroxiredoxin family protein [Actinomycetes bacterium]|jgi:peroxiredoxin Q/BCP|nr:peroxiredoxin family protein [Actinomycetes bacterium]
MSNPEAKPTVRPQATRRPSASRQPPRGRRRLWWAAGITVLALVALVGVFLTGQQHTTTGGAGRGGYQVGSPGPGQPAPPVRLPTTGDGTFDLGAQRGKTVLLYFQEGLGCQPCWNQLTDIEANQAKFHALGIDQVASITTNPLDALKQKVADEHLTSPVLADPDLRVSSAYQANQYGMMGTSRDGHTFVLVGPDGQIRWRADYGGAPNYTMYVPVDQLLADLTAGLGKTTR